LKAATRRIVSILAQCASPACRRHCVRGMTHPPVRAAGDDGLIGIDLDEGAERSAERQYRPDPQGQAHQITTTPGAAKAFGAGVSSAGTHLRSRMPIQIDPADGDDHPRATVRTQAALAPG